MKKETKKSRKVKKTAGFPLAVAGVNGGVAMLEEISLGKERHFYLSWSIDGINFSTDSKEVSIKSHLGKKKKIDEVYNFCLSRAEHGYVMTFVRPKSKTKKVMVVSKSTDLYSWSEKSELEIKEDFRTTVSYSKSKKDFYLYRDGLFIKTQKTGSISFWKEKPSMVFTTRNNYFDAEKISIIGSISIEEGTLLLYDSSITQKNNVLLQVGAVILDKDDPKKILWRSPRPVWQGVVKMKNQKTKITPLGFVPLHGHHLIYWVSSKGEIIVVTIPQLFKEINESKYHPKILDRFVGNPIIEPRGHHDWEVEGTFNPAVIEDDDGVIHILYRAIGKDGISRVGHAKSLDGKNFFSRSSFPVFEPKMGFGLPDMLKASGPIGYHPAIYTSGGGWGGSEDPRAVRMDDKVYMLYVAFEGWGSVRIALTSIDLNDFKAGNWNWKKPVLISPPGKVNKNWLLFPEKINGKYAILHSIVPQIAIEYIEDIDNISKTIDSSRKDGPQPGRKKSWDSILRGGGPPPIKTELGWLLFYHALEKEEYDRYKLGAMILDKDNPEKVLYRSKHPILSPDMHYENNGKPGVVYASGAIVRGDDLYIYYGGADKVVCVATTPLKEFLHYLMTGNTKPYQLKKV